MRWEYRVEDYFVEMQLTPEKLEEKLNSFGEEGWEVCAVTDIRVIFKRKIGK